MDRRSSMSPRAGTALACMEDVKRIACAIAFATVTAVAGPAAAFCRLTTCQPTDQCPTDERGCPSEGAALRWKQSPIPFRLHARGYSKIDVTPLRAAIRSAFARWSEVTCDGERTSLRFEEMKEAAPNEQEAAYSVVMVNAGWPFAETALAQTTHDFGVDRGFVKSAIIQVNSASHDFRVAADGAPTALTAETAADIESVLVHEVGHYIGLAHSNEAGAIMAPSYCEDDDRCKSGAEASRSLGKDDVDAVCAIHPPASKAPALETDAGEANVTSFGCSTVPNTPQGVCAVWLFGIVLSGFVTARKCLVRSS